MDQILDSPASTQRNIRYAGFWIRVGAYLIDAIILSIVNLVVTYGFFGGYSATKPNYVSMPFLFIFYLLYFVLMESSARQATLGKMAVGIKVGNENGEQISFANALGRYFAKILSSIILFIGYMMAGWDSKKQALHDKLANTYVYYG
jgi:uncharacterized RDD family membrane protein YckC